jgi:hypothetical protein
MTLLRLSPEGERLRRIAKAHAAGEVSTPDYRRIRSDVIEGYADGDGDLVGDDTQQRWLEPVIPPSVNDEAPPPVARMPAERRARPRVVWVALGALLLAMLLGVAAAWSV